MINIIINTVGHKMHFIQQCLTRRCRNNFVSRSFPKAAVDGTSRSRNSELDKSLILIDDSAVCLACCYVDVANEQRDLVVLV